MRQIALDPLPRTISTKRNLVVVFFFSKKKTEKAGSDPPETAVSARPDATETPKQQNYLQN